MNDDLLMADLGHDRLPALAELYRRYADRLLAYARRILGHDQEAEDSMQEVFLKIWEFRHRYRPESHFRAWAFRICLNLCRDRQRQVQRVPLSPPEAADEVETPGIGPEELVLDRLLAEEARKAFSRLESGDKHLLSLRLDGHLTASEVAETLGCSVRTVHYRTAEIVRRLQRSLGEPQ